MAYDGAGSLFALGLRVCKLDPTGAPIAGAQSCYKTDALVTIGLGLNYNEGETISQRRGDGTVCLGYQTPSTLASAAVENLQVCDPDPILVQFLIGGVIISDAGTSEVQTATITGAPTGGTFTLTYSAQTTTPIAFNAAAAAVQTALENLANLVPGDVTVTGSAGGPYTITFNASLGNVVQVTADATGLTGGTAPAVNTATTTPGVAGTEVGYAAPTTGSEPTPNGISVEFWTRAIIDGAAASVLPYMHWVAPRVSLTPDGTLEAGAENPLLPSFTGFGTQNANWGDGPVGDWPYISERVFQYARVASVPDLTRGYVTVTP